MKTLNLAVKLIGSLLLFAVVVLILNNGYTYFVYGGLKGGLSSVIFATVGYGLATAFAVTLFVQLWKLKL